MTFRPEGWLTVELKDQVRLVFEPKYKRSLTEHEVAEIADNLADVVGVCLKYKYRTSFKEKSEVVK